MKTIKKKIVEEIILEKQSKYQFRYRDIDIELQPDDLIRVEYVEEYFSPSESNDAYWVLEIKREREETDLEYNKRISDNKLLQEELRERRYETYLKFKKEFENNH